MAKDPKVLKAKVEEMFKVKFDNLKIIETHALTPDSWISFFKADSKNYCLYTEDYVADLTYISNIIEGSSGSKIYRYLEPVVKQSEPNHYYKIVPAGWNELAKYAAKDGIYYSFLAELSTIKMIDVMKFRM